MNFLLNETEARVLGALIEKDITTPDYYPLSLNALINACNQKNNRDPVTNLDEDSVRQALRSLSEQNLARSAGTDSRVAKYEHRLQEVFNFHRHEIAILCVLLLRGPQTPGELRTRTERMYHFDDLDAVQSALQMLMKREPALVKVLPRQPGTKEVRYAHLLSGEPEVHAAANELESPPGNARVPERGAVERVAQLETEVAALREDVERLREQLQDFRKQFQ